MDKYQREGKTGMNKEEMYKELFFNLTEDTWSSIVVLPPDINTLGRPYWLYSNKIVDLTMLCDSYTMSNNCIAYGCSGLRILRLPNITLYKYPGPTMNGNVTELYIPKCKGFSDKRYCFGTGQSRLDIFITDSTCAEIKAFQNFPGCAVNESTMNKVVFHGSDGTISYQGGEWVVTPS